VKEYRFIVEKVRISIIVFYIAKTFDFKIDLRIFVVEIV
jgi:hypothetical protein